MQVTETLSEGLKREFKVVVDAQDIETKMSGKLDELAGRIAVPGFRPGKVPANLLRKTHGKHVIGEVLEETVNEATQKTLADNELTPAMQPKIEITKFDEGQDLEYTMAIELMPLIEPTDFRAIELERLTVEIDDAMIDERLERMAEQLKSYVDAADDQESADGDAVVIDFDGTVDGEAFDGGEASDFELRLGSGHFLPEFEEQLIGVKKGGEKTVTITFPDDYGQETLAGKNAAFAVTVKQVKVPLPTAVDDAMAEKLGLENLDALKKSLREQIERDFGGVSRTRLKRNLLDALSERHDFELPPGMVDMEFDAIWGQFEADLERQGKTIAEQDKSEEETRVEYREIADRRVRLGLLLSEVGRLNNIEVQQDEVNRAISEQARNFPGQEQQVFEYFQSNLEAQAQMRAPILEDKVCDFILEMATVSERKVSVDELMREPDEDGAEDGAGAESAANVSEDDAAAEKADG